MTHEEKLELAQAVSDSIVLVWNTEAPKMETRIRDAVRELIQPVRNDLETIAVRLGSIEKRLNMIEGRMLTSETTMAHIVTDLNAGMAIKQAAE